MEPIMAQPRTPVRIVEDEVTIIMERVNRLRDCLSDETLPLQEQMEIRDLIEFYRGKLARLLGRFPAA